MRKNTLRLLFPMLLTLASSNIMAMEELNILVQTPKTVFSYEEPVLVHFILNNTGKTPIDLKLCRFPFLNYHLEVFTPQNVSVKERDEFFAERLEINELLKNAKKREDYSPYKDMSLEPSQLLGVKINLLDYYDLKPGVYILKGRFFPLSSALTPRRSYEAPHIKLIIKENVFQKEQQIETGEEESTRLKNIKTPIDSVEAFFEGKMKKDWDKFFYVVDLRRMIKQFPVFYEQYQKVADNEKNEVVSDFRVFLQELNADERIMHYDIVETVIRKNKAVANVILTSRWRGAPIKREYRLALIKKDHWYVYAYTVVQK